MNKIFTRVSIRKFEDKPVRVNSVINMGARVVRLLNNRVDY